MCMYVLFSKRNFRDISRAELVSNETMQHSMSLSRLNEDVLLILVSRLSSHTSHDGVASLTPKNVHGVPFTKERRMKSQ